MARGKQRKRKGKARAKRGAEARAAGGAAPARPLADGAPASLGAPSLPAAAPAQGAALPPPRAAWERAAEFLARPHSARWLLVVLVLCAYAGAFWVPFLFDDAPVVTRNRLLWNLGDALELVKAKPTRALTNLSFLLNFQLAHLGQVPQLPYGIRDWWSYHAVSLGLHALNAVLLYELLRRLLRVRPEGLGARTGARVALAAAALWAVHPANVMAVAYIAQRYALTAGLAFLGTLLLYVRLRDRMEALGTTPREEWKGYLAVAACSALALGTKENAALVPAAVVLVELVVYGGRRLAPAALFFVPHTLGALAYLALAGPDGFVARFLPARSPTATRTEYLVTQVPVTLRYLHLWLFPYDLTVEQAFPILWNSQRGGFDPEVPGAAALFARAIVGHALIVALAAKLWLRGLRWLPLAVGWYYLTHVVESSFIPILDPMVDHRMYVPTLLLPAAALVALARGREGLAAWWPALRRGVPLGVAVLVAAAAVGTFLRVRVWSSATGLWEDTLRKRPDCARAWSSLGMEKLYREDWLGAVGPIETALQLAPVHVEGWNNLGKAYLELGRWKRAEYCLLRGIEANEVVPSPSVRMCWNNVGLVYEEMAKEVEGPERRRLLQKAARHLRRAIELSAYYEAAHTNLARVEWKLVEASTDPEERRLHARRVLEVTRRARALARARGALLSLPAVRRGALALGELGGEPEAFEAIERLLPEAGVGTPLFLEDLARLALRAHAAGRKAAPQLLARAAAAIDREVVQQGGGYAELAVLRGRLAAARGQPEQGARFLRAALRLDPARSDAAALRAEAEALEGAAHGPQGPAGPGRPAGSEASSAGESARGNPGAAEDTEAPAATTGPRPQGQ
ncbi:MAG: hypothetical protein D6731_22285 [Planctomycetota bacterium]|nr:MAG: hypothetical protein D6731_22285 [Planctomycetota bacterium]